MATVTLTVMLADCQDLPNFGAEERPINMDRVQLYDVSVLIEIPRDNPKSDSMEAVYHPFSGVTH